MRSTADLAVVLHDRHDIETRDEFRELRHREQRLPVLLRHGRRAIGVRRGPGQLVIGPVQDVHDFVVARIIALPGSRVIHGQVDVDPAHLIGYRGLLAAGRQQQQAQDRNEVRAHYAAVLPCVMRLPMRIASRAIGR